MQSTPPSGSSALYRSPGLADALWLTLPSAIVLVLYFPAIFNGFVWDDWVGMVEMPFMTAGEQAWLIVGGNQFFSTNFFRPLTSLFFLLEHQLIEPYPVYYHLTNVVLHATNTLLLTLIARRFFCANTEKLYIPAVLIPLLYGLHPALVEPVAWISGRVDLIVTFFLLLALWFDYVIHNSSLRATLVAVAYLCGLLSKEMAAPFPLVLLLWHLAAHPGGLRPLSTWWQTIRNNGSLHVYCALTIAAGLYLAARYAVLGHWLVDDGPAPQGIDTPLDRLLLVTAALGEILRMASGPLTQQLPLHFLELPLSLRSNHVWLGLVLLSSLVVVLAHSRLRFRRAAWLWLATLATLLPVANLIPIRSGPGFMAERFLAFPLTLASIAAVASLRGVTRKQGVILLSVALIWLSASALVISRQIPRWENDQSLWQWSIEILPNSSYAHLNLMYALKQKGLYAEAIAVAQRALSLEDEQFAVDLRSNLGFMYLATGNPAAAVEQFSAILALEKGMHSSARFDILGNRRQTANLRYTTHLNLGNALMELGRDAEALRHFEKARDTEPEEPSGHYNMGLYHLEHGAPALAAEHFGRALDLYKETRKGRQNQLYIMRGIADTEKMLARARASITQPASRP